MYTTLCEKSISKSFCYSSWNNIDEIMALNGVNFFEVTDSCSSICFHSKVGDFDFLLSFFLLLTLSLSLFLSFSSIPLTRKFVHFIFHSLTINFISFRFQILFSMYMHFGVHGTEFSDSAFEIKRNEWKKNSRKLVS